ncbi:T9SS type B sorting domain-containing protein [Flavobacterium lindanitolerans]|nr:T9SS type B sorting domain-containing protein [Flavobacterium lindanitolerans]
MAVKQRICTRICRRAYGIRQGQEQRGLYGFRTYQGIGNRLPEVLRLTRTATTTRNIIGLADQPEASIYIFDRYGKLLKQISPAGNGWDGTMNGSPLPSTDYWFKVLYKENNASKEFKAHFSLKR